MTSFLRNIPSGSVDLNIDYQNLQNNFNQSDTSFGVDHVAFSVPVNNGYHTNIHSIPNSTTTVNNNGPTNYPPTPPTATGGFGQVWSAQINDGLSTDEALYWISGGNKSIQLTSNMVPDLDVGGNGKTFMAGGLIVQWGFVNTPATSTFTTLTFSSNAHNIAFPKNCFGVFTQPYSSSTVPSLPAIVDIKGFTVVRTSFQWAFITSDASYNGFYWIAIGN